jgi:hypothetical protein
MEYGKFCKQKSANTVLIGVLKQNETNIKTKTTPNDTHHLVNSPPSPLE